VLGARKLGRLRRGKLSIRVTCPGSCRVKARLISGRTVVASRSRTRLGGGTVTLRPKVTKKGRKLIKRHRRLTMTLAVDVTDDQGRTTTLARVLRFRR
jgi:molybdenum-dependent DNA-binding transcriptional regulator ModE